MLSSMTKKYNIGPVRELNRETLRETLQKLKILSARLNLIEVFVPQKYIHHNIFR